MGEDRLIRIKPSKTNFNARYERGKKIELNEVGYLPKGKQEEFVKEIHWFSVGEWKLETEDNQIKIGCPRCGCGKKNIIYQKSGQSESLRCLECGLTVDDRAVIDGQFDDIFKFWNWLSYSCQEFDVKWWEEYMLL